MAFKNKKVHIVENVESNELQQDVYYDDWMRDDYILVSNKVTAKDLKLYQRMVVLRRPNGQQKCIIDKSLSFSEVKRIQALIAEHGYIDINSLDFKRIIPSDYKKSSEPVDLSVDETEKVIKSINNINSTDFAEFAFNPYSEVESILKLKDENINISIKKKDTKPIKNTVDDTDLIDDVRIFIPHEERKIKWNTLDEHLDENLVDKYQHDEEQRIINEQKMHEDVLNDTLEQFVDPNYVENDVIDNVDGDVQNEFINTSLENENNSEELFDSPIDSNENEQLNVDMNELVDSYENEQTLSENEPINILDDNNYSLEENDDASNIPLAETMSTDNENDIYEQDYSDYVEENDVINSDVEIEKPKETITSFFKNEVEQRSYHEPKLSKKKYKFYSDSSFGKPKKIVLNRKLKMFVYRGKINHELIEANERKFLKDN